MLQHVASVGVTERLRVRGMVHGDVADSVKAAALIEKFKGTKHLGAMVAIC